jgi:signal peptidase II
MSSVQASAYKPKVRTVLIAMGVVFLDQMTKQFIVHGLAYGQEKVLLEGFFKFVHWGNTGAAWSLFRGNNVLLATIAVVALIVLFLSRRHFRSRSLLGQFAFGLICGGIVGNLMDRLWAKHVIDFIYFYINQRGGDELGFPAFNIADSAICAGVGLVFVLAWRGEHKIKPVTEGPSKL